MMSMALASENRIECGGSVYSAVQTSVAMASTAAANGVVWRRKQQIKLNTVAATTTMTRVTVVVVFVVRWYKY